MQKNKYSKTALDASAIHLLHRAGQCAGDIFSEEMGLEDLTPRQYAVLQSVAGNEGLNQTELVQLTGIDRSSLADIVRRMLKKGLLVRHRTETDARAYSVKLSAAGWKSLRSAEPAALNADNRILSALPPNKRDEFLKSLNMIVSRVNGSPE